MTTYMKLFAAGASALVLAACTSSGTTEKNAAYGAAAGAVAGAVIGNNTGDGDAQRGAMIGGVLGGAAGAAKGCSEAEDCDMPGVKDQEDERDADGDGYANAYDRYPYDSRRW
ncbi:MAG: YMGG-like glycine zipper-containing protein [Hyphomonas sp.]|uniref:glycine zipper domain-containing protein n=1 Tax=Hyphomonas sp. BRH_c22 TaxID=1629710 RepID=UPI000A998F3E|nr:YMGG-like glycine zipper-containing protein [Hyphomonas sp. BRH_c22]